MTFGDCGRGDSSSASPPRPLPVTDKGLRTALCYHRTHTRVLIPTLSVAFEVPQRSRSRLARTIDAFDNEVSRLWQGQQLAA